jgi:hypothetical protein
MSLKKVLGLVVVAVASASAGASSAYAGGGDCHAAASIYNKYGYNCKGRMSSGGAYVYDCSGGGTRWVLVPTDTACSGITGSFSKTTFTSPRTNWIPTPIAPRLVR